MMLRKPDRQESAIASIRPLRTMLLHRGDNVGLTHRRTHNPGLMRGREVVDHSACRKIGRQHGNILSFNEYQEHRDEKVKTLVITC